jgi:hypothetical protein
MLKLKKLISAIGFLLFIMFVVVPGYMFICIPMGAIRELRQAVHDPLNPFANWLGIARPEIKEKRDTINQQTNNAITLLCEAKNAFTNNNLVPWFIENNKRINDCVA